MWIDYLLMEIEFYFFISFSSLLLKMKFSTFYNERLFGNPQKQLIFIQYFLPVASQFFIIIHFKGSFYLSGKIIHSCFFSCFTRCHQNLNLNYIKKVIIDLNVSFLKLSAYLQMTIKTSIFIQSQFRALKFIIKKFVLNFVIGKNVLKSYFK